MAEYLPLSQFTGGDFYLENCPFSVSENRLMLSICPEPRDLDGARFAGVRLVGERASSRSCCAGVVSRKRQRRVNPQWRTVSSGYQGW